jgi:hypothetical protein
VDILLANAPKTKNKSEIDNMFEVCERDGIHKLQLVSLYVHGIGFVPSSGRQQYTLQCKALETPAQFYMYRRKISVN